MLSVFVKCIFKDILRGKFIDRGKVINNITSVNADNKDAKGVTVATSFVFATLKFKHDRHFTSVNHETNDDSFRVSGVLFSPFAVFIGPSHVNVLAVKESTNRRQCGGCAVL